MTQPVLDVKCVLAATRSTIAVVRPGTKPVATAAGDTVMTRISGPRTRANKVDIVSISAFDAA